MKRRFNVIMILLLLLIMVGCKDETIDPNYIVLPNITGFNITEIENAFELLEVEILITYAGESTVDNSLTFKEYGRYLQVGDEWAKEDILPIILYPDLEPINEYFSILDMIYDGPYLDSAFALIDPVDPRGGYFEVTLANCIDGDTAKFNYPQYIYDAIPGFSNNTRFLNMDTEETYGTPEEWGKPGSNYTCDLLNSAEIIVLQTDPNDDLIDNEDYRRLLAWIWVQLPGEDEYFLLNYMVVIQGLAQVKYDYYAGKTIYYGELTYNEWMYAAEDYAIENNLGQWGDLLDPYWNYDLN